MNKVETLNEAIEKFHNDYDLGGFIRHNYLEMTKLNTFEISEIIKKHSNDYNLGNYIRRYFKNKN